MILIVTSKKDGHIGAVTRHLDDQAVQWVRLNTEDFAQAEMVVSPAEGSGQLFIPDSQRIVNVEEVDAVWFRKPEPIGISKFVGLGAATSDYIEAEFTENLLGLYSLLSRARWINDPFSTRIAHRKMLQLRTATQVGLRTPRTIITNKPDVALAFAEGLPGDVAVKSLGAINVTTVSNDGSAIQYGLFTRRVSLGELKTVSSSISQLPSVFQEFIERQYELRITCVGSSCFACRIESRQDDFTFDDYRFDTKSLHHSPQDCPELRHKLQAYMKALNLNFGCFDVLVTRSGDPVFLECNPNGQWLWVEQMTGLPIGKAIATWLASPQGGPV